MTWISATSRRKRGRSVKVMSGSLTGGGAAQAGSTTMARRASFFRNVICGLV